MAADKYLAISYESCESKLCSSKRDAEDWINALASLCDGDAIADDYQVWRITGSGACTDCTLDEQKQVVIDC